MKSKLKRVHIAAIVAVAGFICAAPFDIQATPPSGISFSPVGRATLPEFNVKRKDKILDWRIGLDADQPVDVATQVVTFQPGGFSGWHTHPGPVFFTVRTGTLTVYEGDDPSCTPLTFPAGTGAVEAGTGTHIHMVRNETGTVAEAVVTYLVPVVPPRTSYERTCQIRGTVRSEPYARCPHAGPFVTRDSHEAHVAVDHRALCGHGANCG